MGRFRAEKCNILIVAGASGTGKTTLVDTLVRGTDQTFFNGYDFTGWKPILAKNIQNEIEGEHPNLIIHYDISTQAQRNHENLDRISTRLAGALCITLVADHRVLSDRLKVRRDRCIDEKIYWSFHRSVPDSGSRQRRLQKRLRRIRKNITMYRGQQQLRGLYANWFRKIHQHPVLNHCIVGSQSEETSHNNKLVYTPLQENAQSDTPGCLDYDFLCRRHWAAISNRQYQVLPHQSRS